MINEPKNIHFVLKEKYPAIMASWQAEQKSISLITRI